SRRIWPPPTSSSRRTRNRVTSTASSCPSRAGREGDGVRAIWKGHISVGLVNVPVSLYPAETRTDLSLHMVDSRDFARVRYERVNADTGEEVPWDQIVKAYEHDSGNLVVFEKDELEKAAPEATKTVEIEAFVNLD